MNGGYRLPNPSNSFASAFRRRLRLCCLLLAVPASVAFGQADDAGQVRAPTVRPALADALGHEPASAERASNNHSVEPEQADSFAEFIEEVESETAPVSADHAAQGDTGHAPSSGKSRLKVGMSLEEALKVVGKTPDSQSEIGAACGKFDVLTWDEDGTRLISVGGTISSVYEGKQKPQE